MFGTKCAEPFANARVSISKLQYYTVPRASELVDFPGLCEIEDRSGHGLVDEGLYGDPDVGAKPLSPSHQFGAFFSNVCFASKYVNMIWVLLQPFSFIVGTSAIVGWHKDAKQQARHRARATPQGH